MYNNPYINSYNPQNSIDRINSQIAELEKMKTQIPMQQPAINQTFQLAPTGSMKYVNSIEDVNKEIVTLDTPFFSKDLSIVWIKNNKGEIKTYELNEIVPLDEKDLQIQYLQEQIEELKKEMIKNEQYVKNDDEQFDETSTTENDGTIGTATKTSKSSSVSRISTSKTKQSKP